MFYVKPGFRGVMLNITDNCNLRCKYCFVNKSPHYMSLQVAKDTLDLLVNINEVKEIVPEITFFGGEPTLCWESIIVPLVEYAKGQNKQVQFHITSNGVVLDEKKLKYMQDNNISLLLSIDGIKECQDINRPFENGDGSFDIINNNIPNIIKYRPDTTFRATLYPETCHTLFDSILFAEKSGFKSLFVVPDEGSIWTEDKKQVLQEQLDKFTDYYINKIKNSQDIIDVTPIGHMFTMFNTYRQVLDKVTDCSSCPFPNCGLGIDYVSVNYEGKIFACQELPTNNNINNKYLIGDIYNGIDRERHEKLLDEYKKIKVKCINETRCAECNISPICNRLMCHANSYIYNKDMSKKTEIKCFWDNLLFMEASKIINALEKNDTFIKIYLKRILNG